MVYWVARAYQLREGIMSNKIFVPALLAAALSAAIPALAQDRNYQDRNDRNGYTQRDDRGDDRYQQNDRRDNRYQNDRRDNRYQNDRRDDRDQGDRRDDRRHDRTQGNYGRTENFNAGYDGYGPDHDLRRGGHLPSRYRNHQYVVNDWRAHHLHAPPRGQQWVQVGADYVLVAAATGLIMQAVSGQ
jgi:Ni/Co efflux regulator RcnB